MSFAGKLLARIAPSLTAAALATVVVGLAEGLIYSGSVYTALAGAGYLAAFAVPLGALGCLLAALLVNASKVPELTEQLTDEDGNAPRLAALLVVAALSPVVLGTAAFQAFASIFRRTSEPTVVALGSSLLVGGAAIAMILLARPAMLGIARLLRVVLPERAVLTPRRISIYAASLFVLSVALTWLVGVRPRIGELNIDPLYFLIVFGALTFVGYIAWFRLSNRGRLILGALAGIGLALVIAMAAHGRMSRTAVVLEIWGQQPLAGKAADVLFNTRSLADARDREAIAPPPVSNVRPDILLVTLDTVRADRTPPYGGKTKMPNLRRLAKGGAVFEWAFSSGNVTRRSLSTIATGLSPHRVRGRVTGWALKLDPRHVLLAERLRAGGYDTAGFAWSEKFFGRSRFGAGMNHLEYTAEGGQEIVKRVRAFMGARQSSSVGVSPLFTWVHFIDPHGWKKQKIEPPEELSPGKERQWLYEQSLAAVDRYLGALLDIETTNPAGRIVIVTSDHGEGLGDHGAPYHSTDLYNSQIRVPLVVHGPSIRRGRISQPTGHADLAPTVLQLAGFDPITMPESDGQSLADFLTGKKAADPNGGFAHSSMVRDRSVKFRADAIVIGRFKYIVKERSGKEELYDIRADPNERSDLATLRPKVLETMKEELAARRTRERIPPY